MVKKKEKEMHAALKKYGALIQAKGWEAGQPLVEKGVKEYGPDFEKLARALAMLLRTKELLEDDVAQQRAKTAKTK